MRTRLGRDANGEACNDGAYRLTMLCQTSDGAR